MGSDFNQAEEMPFYPSLLWASEPASPTAFAQGFGFDGNEIHANNGKEIGDSASNVQSEPAMNLDVGNTWIDDGYMDFGFGKTTRSDGEGPQMPDQSYQQDLPEMCRDVPQCQANQSEGTYVSLTPSWYPTEAGHTLSLKDTFRSQSLPPSDANAATFTRSGRSIGRRLSTLLPHRQTSKPDRVRKVRRVLAL